MKIVPFAEYSHVRRNCIRLVVALVVVVIVAGAARLWFATVRMGETRTSPDGRYTAEAWNAEQRMLFGRRHWLELRVVDNSTNDVIWDVRWDHLPNAAVPDYHQRGTIFAHWAADSKSVTIDGPADQQLFFPVP